MRGLSEENGSWKIICISRRSGRSSRLAQAAPARPPSRPLAVNEDLRRRSARSRCRMQRAVVVLPQPLSPTRPERLALVDVEADAVDRAHVADRPLQKALANREELLQSASTPRATASRHGAHSVRQPLIRRGSSSRYAGRRPRADRRPRPSHVPGMKSGQRGWNGQPAGRSYGCGTVPRDRRQPLAACALACGESSAAAPGCRGASARERSRRPAPARPPGPGTSRPRRRPSRATTPRSCVMSMIAMPVFAAAARASARGSAPAVVTSSAVVGSSAISRVGLAGQRHRDHRALAQAAAELVG